MILYIDTSEAKKIKVQLKSDSIKKTLIIENQPGSQALLPAIVKILKQQKITLGQIKAIEVHTGPGSFTGLRVGVAVANALSYALKLPVNGKPIGQFVEPKYS